MAKRVVTNDVLRESSEGYIYDDTEKQYFQDEVQVFDRSKPNLRSTVSMPESNWTALSVAREKLKTRLTSIRSLSQKEIDAFYTAAEILVEPSISYDSVATETARTAAAEGTQPRTVTLKRGQKIVDAGDIITADVLRKMSAVRTYASTSRQFNRFAGLLLFVTALFWIGWKMIEVENRGPRAIVRQDQRGVFALARPGRR